MGIGERETIIAVEIVGKAWLFWEKYRIEAMDLYSKLKEKMKQRDKEQQLLV